MADHANDWRPVVAAIADDRVRRAYARLVLGARVEDALADLPSSVRAKVRETLSRSGLVITTESGEPETTGVPFRRLLAAEAAEPSRGVERFLHDGRIDRYPSSGAERRELLELVARRALKPGEVLTEREINERLGPFADDVALLRRNLVDHSVLERTRSGSSYALVP